MQTQYDLVIVGGGLVGASLACALGEQPLRIAVLEAVPLSSDTQPSYDDRAIALAQGTQQIFAALELWDETAMEATPIHRIHVSDRGRFGFVRLDRDTEKVAALGWVAPARALGSCLAARLAELDNVDLVCPAQVQSVSAGPDGVTVRLADGKGELSAGLLVAADGARSGIREQLGMPVQEWSYDQTAVVSNISTQLPNDGVAYERFTEAGPLALLPLGEKRCAVVCTVANADADMLMEQTDAEFLRGLQQRFGFRLGRFDKVGRRHAYPLSLVKARESVAQRVALVGNAAHTLHPIAGQGFNLGLRDVAVLAEVLVDAMRDNADIGDEAVLQRYAQWRQGDHRRVIAFTDGLTRLFGNPLPPVRLGRNLGMLDMDLFPPAKTFFAHMTMGRAGRLSRLARGLPL